MITIDHMHFEIIENYRDAFDEEQFQKKYSDVLNKYDYIVGDIGYEKLRLAGFFRDNKSKVDRDKKFSAVQDYLYEYCNFGCAYFILRKVPKSEIKEMIENGELEERPDENREDDSGESAEAENKAEDRADETPADETSGPEPGAEVENQETDEHPGEIEKTQKPDQQEQKQPGKRKNPSRSRKKSHQPNHKGKQKQNDVRPSTNKTLAAHQSFKKS